MAAYEELIKSGKINWKFNAISSDFGSKTGNDIKDHNEITNKEKLELKILSQLDDLEFPLDELGTYLYRKVILGVIYYIKKVPEKNDPYYKELKEALKDKTSQFYFNLAKNDLDLPLNSFHAYIENAMAEMNQRKFNDASFDEIRNHEKDYGELAFEIGYGITSTTDFDILNKMVEEKEGRVYVMKLPKKK